MAFLNSEGVSYLWVKIKTALQNSINSLQNSQGELDKKIQSLETSNETIMEQMMSVSHTTSGNLQEIKKINETISNWNISQSFNWNPSIYTTVGSTTNQITCGVETAGGYYRMGPIVYIWCRMNFRTNVSGDFIQLNLPFTYNFTASGAYGAKGQLIWRFDKGEIKDKQSHTVPLGFYPTNQVAYSSTLNKLIFSANKDQYIAQIASNTQIFVSGWYATIQN